MNNLETDIVALQERNRRVEADKAWELSWARTLIIAAMIYVIAAVFLWNMYTPSYLLQALIPAGGWMLSTASLPWFKTRWMKKRNP